MYNGGFNYPLSKEFITELKRNDNERLLLLVNDNINNCNNLAFILEHLGYLPMNYDYSWIVSLTNHKNEDIRLLAVKNIAKQSSVSNIDLLLNIVRTDECTMVRREAVSAIGRMRAREAVPYLINILSDEDPKIVCQAIRGLLVFKGDTSVDNS